MKKQMKERYRVLGIIGLLGIGVLCGNKGIVAQAQENMLYENGYYYEILDNGTVDDTTDDTVEILLGINKTEVVILDTLGGKPVTSIGKAAFENCNVLKTVTVKSTTLRTIEKNTFKGTNKKLVIKVPKKKAKTLEL